MEENITMEVAEATTDAVVAASETAVMANTGKKSGLVICAVTAVGLGTAYAAYKIAKIFRRKKAAKKAKKSATNQVEKATE